MYNPASIVDLRKNISFNRPRSSSSLNSPQPLCASNSLKSLPRADSIQHNCNSLFDANLDAFSRFQTDKTMELRINQSFAAPPSQNPSKSSCQNCLQLNQKVVELEARVGRTEGRVSMFEAEVLEYLRSISRGQSNGKELHRGFQDLASSVPGPTPSSSNQSFHIARSTRSDSSEATRQAIAGACRALENLIANASVR